MNSNIKAKNKIKTIFQTDQSITQRKSIEDNKVKIEDRSTNIDLIKENTDSIQNNVEENLIKRNLTSYQIYQNEIREKVKKENPGITGNQVHVFIGKLWEKLSEKEKKKYYDKAAEDKERYLNEMRSFININKESNKNEDSVTTNDENVKKLTGKKRSKPDFENYDDHESNQIDSILEKYSNKKPVLINLIYRHEQNKNRVEIQKRNLKTLERKKSKAEDDLIEAQEKQRHAAFKITKYKDEITYGKERLVILEQSRNLSALKLDQQKNKIKPLENSLMGHDSNRNYLEKEEDFNRESELLNKGHYTNSENKNTNLNNIWPTAFRKNFKKNAQFPFPILHNSEELESENCKNINQQENYKYEESDNEDEYISDYIPSD